MLAICELSHMCSGAHIQESLHKGKRNIYPSNTVTKRRGGKGKGTFFSKEAYYITYVISTFTLFNS